MNQAGVVPTTKSDIAAAERAVALGWPGVKPVISELLEWIQDYNWPVAHTLVAVSRERREATRSVPAANLRRRRRVVEVLVIDAVLANAPDELVADFTPLLVRIADHPTPGERTEELDQVAATVLGRGRG